MATAFEGKEDGRGSWRRTAIRRKNPVGEKGCVQKVKGGEEKNNETQNEEEKNAGGGTGPYANGRGVRSPME